MLTRAGRALRGARRESRRAGGGGAGRGPGVLLRHGPPRDAPATGRPKGDPESGVTQVFQQMERSRHPTIAMVHGAASRAAASWRCTATCASPPRGALRHAAGAHRPRRAVRARPEAGGDHGPRVHAADLFTGPPIDAPRAYEMGMVHQVVAPAEIENGDLRLWPGRSRTMRPSRSRE